MKPREEKRWSWKKFFQKFIFLESRKITRRLKEQIIKTELDSIEN